MPSPGLAATAFWRQRRQQQEEAEEVAGDSFTELPQAIDLLVARLQLLEHKHTYDVLPTGEKAIVSTTTVCQFYETAEAAAAAQNLNDEDEDGCERVDEDEDPAEQIVTVVEIISYYTTGEEQRQNRAIGGVPCFEEEMVLSFWRGLPGDALVIALSPPYRREIPPFRTRGGLAPTATRSLLARCRYACAFHYAYR